MGFTLAPHRRKIMDVLMIIAIGVALAALVMFPQETTAAAKDGLLLCYNAIIPSLFPFFVLSTIMVETGVMQYLGRLLEPLMRPLFNVGGDGVAAFALGFVGGYPVGAKTVISLYENGRCSKVEAERLLSFCNNSGPAFIFGVVGAGVFASGKIGLLLYLAHSVASIIVGVIFRGWGRGAPIRDTRTLKAAPRRGFTAVFSDAVRSAFQTSVSICGFVIFFTIFIKLLFFSGALPAIASAIGGVFAPLGFDEQWAERLLTGLIELTSGVWTLKGAEGHLTGSVAMAAFMLGWAGLSVHSQVLSFLGESGLSVKTYIIGKALQGAISAAFIFVLSRVMTLDVPAAYLAEQVSVIADVSFLKALSVSTLGSLAILLITLLAVRYRNKIRRKG